MTVEPIYARDRSLWVAFHHEITELEQQLPDGAQRRTRFVHEMRFTDMPDAYLSRTPVLENGLIVEFAGPGPKALAYRDGLLAALEGGAA